jgi:hypothetical protein
MKPVQTKFGQSLQLAETRQQVAGLQVQVEKLKSDIKELRDMDRQIFDDQDKEISALKALVKEYHEFNKYDAPALRVNYRQWDAERNALQARAQTLLQEES